MSGYIQKILFGSPGTGKSYKVEHEILPALGSLMVIIPSSLAPNHFDANNYNRLSRFGCHPYG